MPLRRQKKNEKKGFCLLPTSFGVAIPACEMAFLEKKQPHFNTVFLSKKPVKAKGLISRLSGCADHVNNFCLAALAIQLKNYCPFE